MDLVIPVIVGVICLAFSRVIQVWLQIYSSTESRLEKKGSSIKTVLCIGSGGHTSELLRLFEPFDKNKFQPRLYIMADNDFNSESKIREFEQAVGDGQYEISKIPRSRNVAQTYSSSAVTTLYSTINTAPIIFRFRPDVVLCNGPGTCIPICLMTFILRCSFIQDCRIVFIESICRVKTLSLTGKIMQFFADVMVVQWPQLKDVCPRALYFGRLT